MNKEEQRTQARNKAIQTVKEYSEFSQACKSYALARRARSPVQVERTPEIMEKITEYMQEQRQAGKPLTHAGFIRCFGVDDNTYYKLDQYDYVIEEFKALHDLPPEATEYIDEDGTIYPLVSWGDIKKNVCDNAIMEQLEENIYSQQRGVNPAGSIFGLKARFQWSEDGTPQHVVNNLVIADGEQAQKALKMLMRP